MPEDLPRPDIRVTGAGNQGPLTHSAKIGPFILAVRLVSVVGAYSSILNLWCGLGARVRREVQGRAGHEC